MPYTIKIPGKMYRALMERDALTGRAPEDQAALAVFKEAVPHEMGHGNTFVVTGEEDVVEYILGYLQSLVGLVDSRMAHASEFGVTIRTMRRVATQAPVQVR